ncbi:MAG: YlmC/YmxH family sporulation protein [Eubacteriales bacterium]|nr:YlmC/YmxH family sporulation protein [Eubacteriales bacterium]
MDSRSTFCELKRKEVVNLCDGAKLGHICDLELEVCTGTVLAIIVPGCSRMLGILKSNENIVIPFCRIKKFGEDVILVELS